MSLMKVGIITLTLGALVITPSLTPLLDPEITSSEIQTWKSSNTENFDGLNGLPDFTQDYNFRTYSPDISDIINNYIEGLNVVVSTANNMYQGLINFLKDPFNLGEETLEAIDYLISYNRILTTLANAQSIWEDSSFQQQQQYTLYIYPSFSFLTQWLYYSPSELNA